MDHVKIGSFLKELRKEKGKTQEEIASMLGTSSRSVSRW
ncbi:MAG: helix-turn-helix transcriptional regulator [Clostridiales bacterium]|nr:helix-turn-helix transcriptional regulator [Clostridiales bacterium]